MMTQTTTTTRTMRLRYGGKCLDCGKYLGEGTVARWTAGKGVQHAEAYADICARYAEQREARRELAAKQAAERDAAQWPALKAARTEAATAPAPAPRRTSISECRLWTRDEGCPAHGELCAPAYR